MQSIDRCFDAQGTTPACETRSNIRTTPHQAAGRRRTASHTILTRRTPFLKTTLLIPVVTDPTESLLGPRNLLRIVPVASRDPHQQNDESLDEEMSAQFLNLHVLASALPETNRQKTGGGRPQSMLTNPSTLQSTSPEVPLELVPAPHRSTDLEMLDPDLPRSTGPEIIVPDLNPRRSTGRPPRSRSPRLRQAALAKPADKRCPPKNEVHLFPIVVPAAGLQISKKSAATIAATRPPLRGALPMDRRNPAFCRDSCLPSVLVGYVQRTNIDSKYLLVIARKLGPILAREWLLVSGAPEPIPRLNSKM